MPSMAGGKELFTRLLRESVLTLCREAYSHRRFIIDGIVCISLEDDNNGDDCSPIVVTIHEQLLKDRDGSYPPSPTHLKSPPCELPSNPLCPRSQAEGGVEVEREKRQKVPVDKKTHILRRVQQAEAEDASGRHLSWSHGLASRLDYPQRSVSEPHATKPEGRGAEEEEVMDGHVSDPTPLAGGRSMTRHSLSQCSDGSDSAERGRAFLSSPAGSDVSSSTHEDVSVVGRAGSASPQDDATLQSLAAGLSSRHSRHLSRHGRGRFGAVRREDLSCQVCGLGLPSVFSLERHNRQKHSLFTCTQCLTTFSTHTGLRSHHRLHVHRSARRSTSHAALARRDSRQRHMYMYMSQLPPRRTKRRVEEHCDYCTFVGRREGDLGRHLLTHLSHNRSASSCTLTHVSRSRFFCSPCDLTFSDPVTYTAHVKCHSQDRDFDKYQCCYCPAVLKNYQTFMLHQQAHALQLPQVLEGLQYSRQFHTVQHLRQQILKHANQQDLAGHPQLEGECFNGNVSGRFEKIHLTEDGNTGKKKPKEDTDGEMEGGPRQSWCTECVVGFPDEDALIDHITVFHESSFNKPQHDQPVRGCSSTDPDEARSNLMDTSEGPVKEEGEANIPRSVSESEDMEKETSGNRTTSEKTCPSGPDVTVDRAAGEVSSMETERMETERSLQGFPSRSEDLNQSLQNAESAAANLIMNYLPRSRASPLKMIPLPFSLEHVTDPAELHTGTNSKTGPLITLVKPKDLIIRTEPYPRVASTSPAGSTSLAQPHLTGQDLSLSSQKKSAVKTTYSLLSGVLQSGSQVRRSEPDAAIKQEPVLSGDSEMPSLPLRLALARDGVALSYCSSEPGRHSPDLPTDLSMPRASSTSPRSASATDGSKAAATFEKVVTPEVPFRARTPLQCPVQDCCQEFPTFPELEEHSARLHRRYLCSYCGKSFTAKPNRDRHVRVHTGVKPYKCQLCPQAFYRGDDLKYHVTTKHPRDTEY
ncbi:uncharacterized protein LOC143283747 [Babylonia areolata]|uniref:uncharacterized protein LOC143283747 n=1 Tax=Babylonia areolata TaxID=304850 RepID=UPI003FD192CC